MNEQWAKTCTRHGPYGGLSCQQCVAEQGQSMITPRTESLPAVSEWDGEWPPINTPCEITTNDGHNWHETELLYSDGNVILLRGYELYKKADPDVRCRPIRSKEQREREAAVRNALALDKYPGGENGVGGLMSRRAFCEALYDAGLLHKGGE